MKFSIWTMFQLYKQLGEKVFVFRKVTITDEERDSASTHLFQRLALAIQKGKPIDETVQIA